MTEATTKSGAAEFADESLLADVTHIVETAAARLANRFRPNGPRPATPHEIVAAIHDNDDQVIPLLRDPLLAIRSGSRWVEDELEGGPLPPGEWWVVDPAEGNINHVHGTPDFAVTATLIRDNRPVLTVVRLPMAASTYGAVAGKGAWQDGTPLQPSRKTDLELAMVGTGQARPGEGPDAFRRIGESVTAMLNAGVVMRVSVPATLQLINVASGRSDVFWQFSNVRSGLAAGALLVSEAGAPVTDVAGVAWSMASESLLAAAPGIHAAAVDILSGIR